MRVLVAGSRGWTSAQAIWNVLDELAAQGPITVIEGGARGADRAAADWAVGRGMELLEFPADWTTHGKAAGPIRNQQMLEEGRPDLVVAFADDLGASRGTKDMVTRAHRAGVPARIFSSDGPEGDWPLPGRAG
jgi:hypothetical protein